MPNIQSATRSTPLVLDSAAASGRAIQIAPKRRHASSNYYYHSEILEPYGISRKDWDAFTRQFVNANLPTRNETIAVATVAVLLDCIFTFALGPVGLPVGAILAGAFVTGPVFFALKGHRLRHHVRNGDIKKWLNAWNTQYFNPKGLMIGFNLPGRRISGIMVAPKPRRSTFIFGQYKKPKSQWSVSRRPRLVIVRLNDPVPDAGSLPQIAPIKTSRVYESKHKL